MNERQFGSLAIALAFAAAGCSHPVTVKNRAFEEAATIHRSAWKTPSAVGVRPFASTDRHTLLCYDSIVTELEHSGAFSRVVRNYNGQENVDLVLDIEVDPQYRVDRWKNLFIQWPGFLIATPHWHGLVYTLLLHTRVNIEDPDGEQLGTVANEEEYEIRYTSTGRGIITGFPVGWFLFGSLSLLSNAYIAWDDPMRDEAYEKLEREHGLLVGQEVIGTLTATSTPSGGLASDEPASPDVAAPAPVDEGVEDPPQSP
jgi:hypothetical protein